MNSRHALVAAGLLGLASVAPALGKPLSDLVSPEKRRSIVERAQHLTRPPEPAPLPADFVQPFNPPNFDQPDPEEVRAAAAARAAAAPASGPAGSSSPGAPGQPAAPAGDRELLESMAARLPVTGTIFMGNEPLLVLGRRNMKVGFHFTVTNPANGQDYELEIVAIDRTTFTLRYRNEEITRPIKPGKSQ